MTPPYVQGVDSSFDPLTPEEAQNLKEAGVVVFYQCLWTASQAPYIAAQNLRVADEAGLIIGAYISVNSSGVREAAYSEGLTHVQLGRSACPDDLWAKLKFVAVDVELPGTPLGTVIGACNQIINYDQRPVIYTNFNSWHNFVTPQNSHYLSAMGVYLINAYWDLQPDIDFPKLPFGGWKNEQVLAEQWSGGRFVEGQFVDRNTFNLDLLLEEEEHMSNSEYEELKEAIASTQEFFAGVARNLNDRVNGLVCTTRALERTVAQHFQTHNTGGGVIERAGTPLLGSVQQLVAKSEADRQATIDEIDQLSRVLWPEKFEQEEEEGSVE